MDIFFILTFQFVKYSMMLQWLYNHLFQAVQSMFQLIQVNRPMCNHPLQVAFLHVILELLVCTWRQGGHVCGQEQKHFYPFGTKLYFHVNSSRKNAIVLTPSMAALSRGCKPRIEILFSTQLLFKFKKILQEFHALVDTYSSDAINSNLQKVLRLLK